MKVHKLDHVNIRTTQLENMIEWYETILGMQNGPRPDFPFPGAWMYLGDAAPVHLIGIAGTQGTGSEVELKLEHFAFAGSGRVDFESLLNARDIEFRKIDIPDFNTVQINLWDPDGNHIHVDFPLDE